MLVNSGPSTGTHVTATELLAAPVQKIGGPVFRLIQRHDDRINGSIPVWGAPETPAEQISQTLAASTSRVSPDTNLALSLAASDETALAKPDESFGFFDLLDMINPLQHIPIVGTIYRAVTGDDIKPIAQIIGGAVFGGPIGAVGGVANAIVAEATGQDIGGNVLGFIRGNHTSGTPDLHEAPDTTIAMANLSYRRPHYNE